MWATDNNKVQEFMFDYLKDPLREVDQPYFHQDEVQTLTTCPAFFFPLFSKLSACPFLGLCSLMEKM